MEHLLELRIPDLWGFGLRGRGVHVGVVGTGIDLTHPDFVNQGIVALTLTQDKDVSDLVAHETGVTWVIHRIAPEAHITVIKVQSRKEGLLSDVIIGCEKLRELGAEIINLSMSTDEPASDSHPVSQEANHLVRQGVVVVAAAGNRGPRKKTIGAPGSSIEAITVGKVDARNFVTWDSSRGPTRDGFVKPDCVAPGADIDAAVPSRLGARYGRYDCTSFSTPHVTGILALLKEAYPSATPALLKRAIMQTCQPVTTALSLHPNPVVCGAGLVNASRAFEWLRDYVS